MRTLPFLMCAFFLFYGCSDKEVKSSSSKSKELYSFEVKGLNEKAYPDNPDWGYCSQNYDTTYLNQGYLLKNSDNTFEIVFLSQSDSIHLSGIDLFEFTPTIPNHLKDDKYLSQLSIINQEWNRNQVKFSPDLFDSDNKEISRIDIARNCLNSYLWEVIIYKSENGKEMPYTHGWFDFPKELYHEMFYAKNGVSFNDHAEYLENWKDPVSLKVDNSMLRTVVDSTDILFEDNSTAMYPLAGARLKKQKEIIFPLNVSEMSDFHTDSSLFATFTPPGYYNKADPRTTELGRLDSLKNISLCTVISKANEDTLSEITLCYIDDNNRITNLTLGGIDLRSLPKLNENEANLGWKNAMGFSNHTFYEDYSTHISTKTVANPYYGYLSDHENKWLDSHKIGIDGPILHWDMNDEKKLHIWLLSFERHALVGHYTITIRQNGA